MAEKQKNYRRIVVKEYIGHGRVEKVDYEKIDDTRKGELLKPLSLEEKLDIAYM
jgi:hypothetical protein